VIGYGIQSPASFLVKSYFILQIDEFLTLINEFDNEPKSSFDLKDLSLFSHH